MEQRPNDRQGWAEYSNGHQWQRQQTRLVGRPSFVMPSDSCVNDGARSALAAVRGNASQRGSLGFGDPETRSTRYGVCVSDEASQGRKTCNNYS